MQRTRRSPRLTHAQRSEMWRRYRCGDSVVCSISRALGSDSSSTHGMLAVTGGISSAERRQSRLAFTLDEREEISRGLARSDSVRALAARLGRAPSTVSREVRRNGGRPGYRVVAADARTWRVAIRPKVCKLASRSPNNRQKGIASARVTSTDANGVLPVARPRPAPRLE